MKSGVSVLPPLVDRVRTALPADLPVALVGGAVRDLLLDRPLHDFDFVMPRDARRTARRLADELGAAYVTLDEERDIARLVWKEKPRMSMDFAAYQGEDLEADLLGRDFTLNAIAIDLHEPGRLIDPTGGAKDLVAKQIRPCTPVSLSNDAVRVLRAVRIANVLEARLPAETLRLMRDAVPLLSGISPERLRDELFKILNLRQVSSSLRILEMIGALPQVLPELVDLKGLQQSPPHIYEAWEHTLDLLNRLQSVFDILAPDYDAEGAGSLMIGLVALRLGRYRGQIDEHFSEELTPERSLRALLNLAALYHDVGKPLTRSVEENGRIRFFDHEHVGAELASRRGHALRLSNQEIDRMKTVIANHMRPSLLAQSGGVPSRRAIYHFFKAAGPAGVEVCLLSLADKLATYGTTLTPEKWSTLLDVVRTLLENWWERPQEAVLPPALLNGNEVMAALSIPPGPRVGEILEAIREAQAAGQVTTHGEALDFALNYVK